MSRHHTDVVAFTVRQLLDVLSPSNFLGTNPEVIRATLEERGANLAEGAENAFGDWRRAVTGAGPPNEDLFVPGEHVAVTPGTVVFRNRLIELIHYSPATDSVCAEPVLIVPAWIMKYYILDLSPRNSLVRYLVEQGHTVFMISWRNPGADDADTAFDDYRTEGVMAALDVVEAIVPGRAVQAVGYCLGGTLLAIAAAYMARDGDKRPAGLTLLATQTDFTEAGELMRFIDESQVAYLEDLMREQGFLDANQMAGTFQLLRSNDLIWSRLVRECYDVGGRPVALSDIRVPIFVVATGVGTGRQPAKKATPTLITTVGRRRHHGPKGPGGRRGCGGSSRTRKVRCRLRRSGRRRRAIRRSPRRPVPTSTADVPAEPIGAPRCHHR